MKKFARILVCALLLVSLLAGCGKSSKFNSLAKKYQTVKSGDFSAYEELAPEAYWEFKNDEAKEWGGEFDVKDYIENLEESFEGTKDYEGTADRYEETYGDDWKLSIKVDDEMKVSSEKLEEIQDSLKDSYDIKKDDVTEAYKVFFYREIKGSEDRDISILEYHAVKISGAWYLCDVSEYTDEDGKESIEVGFVFG